MKKFALLYLMGAAVSTAAFSQSVCPKDLCSNIKGKEIYIPKDLQKMNLDDPDSQWSYHRLMCTDNTAIFWEKGFGKDVTNPPQLEGKDMKVDINRLADKLEQFYTFYRDTLQFTKPGSKSDKYRMMVMLNYSLEGTAYGGDYDGQIGALWAAPNRLQDERLNCVAHELGHSFQSQITCDGAGEAWGGCGFFEMTSQWMLWQVNPDWQSDEQYHLDAFMENTHKAYLHLENIYRSPYILEYWGLKHGRTIIGELFRQGKRGEDPVMTYKRVTNLTQKEFCDEMFDASRHLINWDFDRVWKNTRKFANKYRCKLDLLDNGWYQIPVEKCPENYGFNAIPLQIVAPGEEVELMFEGLKGKVDGYYSVHPDKAGWRYGFVAVGEDGKSFYGDICSDDKVKVKFSIPKNKKISYLWLVVMGAPAEHWMNPSPRSGEKDAQWPYKVKFKGTKPIFE